VSQPFFFMVVQSPGAKKEWRWRMYAAQDRLVAVSGEGYADKAACVQAVDLLSAQSARPDIRFSRR
jgi:uncharacterized protein YegP (UPF0339 family)